MLFRKNARGSNEKDQGTPRARVPESVPDGGNDEFGHQVMEALARVLRILGRHAFDLDDRVAEEVRREFDRWARHVLVGVPMTEDDGEEEPAPVETTGREWSGLHQFVLTHRQREQTYVTHSLHSLRDALWLFTRTIGRAVADDQESDRHMRRHLGELQAASETRSVEEMRRALLAAVDGIGHLVEERTQRQRARIEQLGEKLRDIEAELGNARKQMALDPLTRLYNRAALDVQMERVAGFSALAGTMAWLLMVDIDHFKRINDTYGHLAGDAVLRQVADRLVWAFPRKSDFIARYGGEELTVLFQTDESETARRMGERVLHAVRQKPCRYEETQIPVTVSGGLARLASGESVAQWLARADQALYEAKRGGRDRICEAPEIGDPA